MFFLVSPCLAFATDTNGSDEVEYTQFASFWHWFAGKSSPLHSIIGYSFGSVCPESEDGFHHSSRYDRSRYDSDKSREVYLCTCEYCGHTFEAYESDLKQSYEAQVAEMPAPGYSSNGELRWRLTVDRFEPKDSNADVGFYVSGTSYSVSIRTERYL